MDEDVVLKFLDQLLVPLVLGIVSWFVKDHLFVVYARRDEIVRREWERRLQETWSPLYYWSGIVIVDGDTKGFDRHGLSELENVLAKSAHLIRQQHYNTLIRLIQTLTNQKTTMPTVAELRATRQYIHEQIRTLNYLLYRRSGWFEATAYTDFFASAKYLLRFLSQALKHIVVWLAIASVLWSTYIAYENAYYYVVAGVTVAILIPVLYDWYRQIKVHRELHRLTGK